MRSFRRLWPAALYLMALSAPGLADSIVFSNGRAIEGIIVEETDKAVTLDLGAGRTTVARSRIQRIERDPEANARIRDDWAGRYVLHDRYVPGEWQPLVARFKALQTRRAAATKARDRLSAHDSHQLSLHRRITAEHARHAAMGRELQAIDPKLNVQAYNAVVTQMAEVVASIHALELEHRQLPAGRTSAQKTISQYQRAVDTFRAAFEEQRAALPAPQPDDLRRLVEYLSEGVDAMGDEFSMADARVSYTEGQHRVTVRLSRTTALLMLDTGASTTAISRATAVRAGIDLAAAQPTRVTLADGSTVNARQALLPTLGIGSVELHNVAVIVMPRPPSSSIDGLLGMNVLRHFILQDGADGQALELRHFEPGRAADR